MLVAMLAIAFARLLAPYALCAYLWTGWRMLLLACKSPAHHSFVKATILDIQLDEIPLKKRGVDLACGQAATAATSHLLYHQQDTARETRGLRCLGNDQCETPPL